MAGQRIVIVGGGFGGAFTARYLRKMAPKTIDIELINSTNYFVFQPLLPEVVSGTISAPDAVTPLRQLLPGVRVRMANVTGIDKEAQTVQLLQGSFRTPQEVTYDHLVVAVGQKTNQAIAPGFMEHSLCIRNLADAHELRNKIIRRLEHADVTEDADLKQRLLTFVVAGGGFSGVETIGELSEMISRTLRFYPNINEDDIRGVLVQADDRILPELPEKLGRYAERILTHRNINVVLNARVASATANAVFLDDDTRIETCLLVTTVGNGPRDVSNKLGIDLVRGKIPVDSFLRVKGEDNIWSLGDAALVPLGSEEGDSFAPPTAQFAVREAHCLAKNLVAILREKELREFAYKPRGSMASIGHYKGVAEILGISISGLFAWLIWRALYIGMLPGFTTRLRVALNWMFDYVLPRSIVQIANRDASGSARRRYSKGDLLSRPGQYIDGFYTVLSGCLESRVPVNNASEDFVRLLGPGDHWGEKTLTANALTQGTLRALEETEVLVMRAEDFRELRQAFPALDEYLDSISDKIYAPSLRDRGGND